MTLVQQHVSGEEAGESGIRLSPEDLPRVDHLVTEDDTPVDNLFSAKQQRLLIEPLYSSWRDPQGRGFLADSNVAIYSAVGREPVVPDAFLSLDVEVPEDWWAKENRSYMLWVYGKAPDVVVEIVSNRKGEELGRKMSEYARMAVPYYALFDPQELLGQGPFRLFRLEVGARRYEPMEEAWMEPLGLGLTLWEGLHEGRHGRWLRWCDRQGNVIPTGAERAEAERQRAEAEHQRAEAERQRAEAERQRAERLAERLRSLGVEVEE